MVKHDICIVANQCASQYSTSGALSSELNYVLIETSKCLVGKIFD